MNRAIESRKTPKKVPSSLLTSTLASSSDERPFPPHSLHLFRHSPSAPILVICEIVYQYYGARLWELTRSLILTSFRHILKLL